METQVRTPQLVFMQPQRLIVPLFQRPYVWNQENQWEPLWNDVVRVTDRLIAHPSERPNPHFLGAVVLQQAQQATGLMQQRTIIDGQQRLTTLQLLLDALHDRLMAMDLKAPAMRLDALVTNAEHFCARPEDRFKVWPTNRDRAAFNAVMGAPPPVDYNAVGHRGERMVEAHRYFAEQAAEWLEAEGSDHAAARGAAIELAVRDFLQMVVIDLGADENAQEIFETLNARGAQLTAADLIKNFVFQRLQEQGADVEALYQATWKEFETGFWETEVNVGRIRYARSSVFLNHWLIARTGEEIVTREVFTRFKTYADFEAGKSMTGLLRDIQDAAARYRDYVTKASTQSGPIDRLGLFGYRTGVLESEVIKPFVLWLLDPAAPSIPEGQLHKALDSLESWMVRRMLVRATTKSYNQVVAELITRLRGADRAQAGDLTTKFFANQTGGSRYWPDDLELRNELQALLAYRRLGRGRLRMVLEAIEDFQRGWHAGKAGLGGERVARGAFAIEHLMPRKWMTHWPLTSESSEADRDRLIHTLGNLTLLTGRLNAKVSNGPWAGPGGKAEALHAHDVLVLNREILNGAADKWSDESIRERTTALTNIIIQIWPAPAGHQSGFADQKARPRRKFVDLVDLISAGLLTPGISLFPRKKQFATRAAVLLPDGQIEVDGAVFQQPSDAATSIAGKRTNGWWFFLVNQEDNRSLRSVRRDYVNSLAAEVDDDDDEGEEDES